MNQDKMWDYYQTEGLDNFAPAAPRLSFLFRRARREARRASGPRVLNIGVGSGWLERRCLEEGWETYSLDPSEAAVRKLEGSGVRGTVGRIEDIPHEDDFFDIVFCSEVLEHLPPPQARRAVREVARVLKTSGVLLGTVPFNEDLSRERVVCPSCGDVFHRKGHFQSFDLDGLRAVFPDDLKVESAAVTYFYDWRSLNWKGKLIALAKQGLIRLGAHGVNENIFFVARKSA